MTMIPARPMDHSLFPLNRRAFLGRYAGAIGTLALAHLLDQEQARAGKAVNESGRTAVERSASAAIAGLEPGL